MDSVLYEQHYRLEDSHWWFLGRRELVLQALHQYAGETPGPLLDVGCGTGGMLPHLARFGPVCGIDSAPEAAAACRQRDVPFMLGWGTSLPFRDGSFGVVTALDVVEHVPDHVGILHEMYRVLRPGGLLLLTVPAYQFLWSRHDVVNHHQRRYRRSSLRPVLREAHFQIAKMSYYNTLLFPLAVARKAMMRLKSEDGPASHLEEVPGPINAVLRRVLIGEKPLIRRWDMPFGASIICAARRPITDRIAAAPVEAVPATAGGL